MSQNTRTNAIVGYAGVLCVVLLASAAGCNPYSTAAKIGIKVVGDVVNDVDMDDRAKQLVGQPLARADATFGQRIRTLQEHNTGRQMITYPVKGDLLDTYRWAIESEAGRIVAIAKLQKNPDGGKSISEKLLLKAIVDGKRPDEIQAHKYFQNLVLTLRDIATGNIIRAYDISLLPAFMGAKYCVLEFDASNTCQTVWIVGAPAASSGSSLSR